MKKEKQKKQTLYYEVVRLGNKQLLQKIRLSEATISYLRKKLSKKLGGVDQNMIQIYPYHSKWGKANISLDDVKPLESLKKRSGFYGTEERHPLIVVIPYVKYALSLEDTQKVEVSEKEVSWTESISEFKKAIIKDYELSRISTVTIKLNGKELTGDELLINFYGKFLEISMKVLI